MEDSHIPTFWLLLYTPFQRGLKAPLKKLGVDLIKQV